MTFRRGLAVFVAMAAMLFLGSFVTPTDAGQVTLHLVNVDAQGVQLWTPTTIIAKKGDTVTLMLNNSLREEHGYEIEGVGVKEVVGANQTKTVSFKATKAGIFPIKCQLHKPTLHMAGQLLVLD